MGPDLSVILPTLNEHDALVVIHAALLDAIAPYRAEIIVVDDASTDGTIPLVERWSKIEPFRLIVRTRHRGLGSAVVEGLAVARGRAIVVMDADGSHEPKSIAALAEPVLAGRAEFVLGSRHVPGGSLPGMKSGRRAISWGAALLARPLTDVRDPMSGFFAVAKPILGRAALAPIGYKIGLEILVKCRPSPRYEVPIDFRPRVAGKSKLGGVQFAGYVRHLARLYRWKIFGGRGRRDRAPQEEPPTGPPREAAG
ncbi:MAG TPA: polyprenol monophosphomannose synthase [Thermoplasmata archaeon]|nr:polyprenol monophosphomannose synthase [Thermoplasmata archaeon]